MLGFGQKTLGFNFWHDSEHVNFTPHVPEHCKALEMIEYFAGEAEVTKHVKACGYRTTKLDISYCHPGNYRLYNWMDLLTPAGMG